MPQNSITIFQMFYGISLERCHVSKLSVWVFASKLYLPTLLSPHVLRVTNLAVRKRSIQIKEQVQLFNCRATQVVQCCRCCSQCLKITEKVAFNIASEASYVYNLSGQKFIKLPKVVNLANFWQPEDFCQTVLPYRSFSIWQKLMENTKLVSWFLLLK